MFKVEPWIIVCSGVARQVLKPRALPRTIIERIKIARRKLYPAHSYLRIPQQCLFCDISPLLAWYMSTVAYGRSFHQRSTRGHCCSGVWWSESTCNVSCLSAGAIYSSNCTVRGDGNTYFEENNAGVSGGKKRDSKRIVAKDELGVFNRQPLLCIRTLFCCCGCSALLIQKRVIDKAEHLESLESQEPSKHISSWFCCCN